MGFDKSRAELAVKKSGGCKTSLGPDTTHISRSHEPCCWLNPFAVQGALEWLEKTQDTPLEELQNQAQAAKGDDEDEEDSAAAIAALESGQTAKSLVCNECGKKFRSQDAAEFHATKSYVFSSPCHALVYLWSLYSPTPALHSGHTDFAESTEEIAPLTEEEKKAKLEELRQKLKDKRANQALQDQEDAKKNEVMPPPVPHL